MTTGKKTASKSTNADAIALRSDIPHAKYRNYSILKIKETCYLPPTNLHSK